MKYKDVQKKKLPDKPGVYFFRGPKKKILYIGKATSLCERVKSYFGKDLEKTRGGLIVGMVKEAQSIDYTQTDSVLEALILEAYLIKKYRPRYNTEGKDDKSFNYVVITEEEFPRVLIVRGKDLQKGTFPSGDIQYLFGPFPHGGIFKEAMKLIRKMFPFRDKCSPYVGHRMSNNLSKPCFNRQIGLCPGVCTGEISKKEYAQSIRHLKLFFEGKKRALMKKLQQEMKAYAKQQKFEKAWKIKKTIFSLNHIQDVALLKQELPQGRPLGNKRIEGYDVAHISGMSSVGVMVVIEGREVKKSDYRKFKIKNSKKGDDTGALKEVITRRLGHNEWQLPTLIVVDGGVAQKNTALKVLKEYGYQIPVVSVVKDERHRPREILGEKRFRIKYEKEILLVNSEAHRFAVQYHRKLRSKF